MQNLINNIEDKDDNEAKYNSLQEALNIILKYMEEIDNKISIQV